MPLPTHPLRGVIRTAVLALAALAVLALAGVAQAAAPPNDDLANATSLGSAATGSSSGTTVESTMETNEQSGLVGYPGDVWFTWTAPATGPVAFRTTNPDSISNLDTVMTVDTGSDITNLSTITTNDDYPGCCTSRVLFNAVEGTTYDIGVAPYSETNEGSFGLEWGASDYYDQDNPGFGGTSATTGKNSITLSFTALDDTASVVGASWLTTACSLDGGASYTPCTSGWTRSVPGGTYHWVVRATDGAGNTGTTSGTAKVKGSKHPH